MKRIGMILLVTGVGLSAAGGIQLGAGEYDATVAAGRAVLDAAPAVDAGPEQPAMARLAGWFAQAGVQFTFGLALVVVGAVLGRFAGGRNDTAEDVNGGRDIAVLLERLARRAEDLSGIADGDECRLRIDRLLAEQVLPIVEARASLQRRIGLAGCAAVLGPIAGGERLLNRAWSALVDGHAQETDASLAGAVAQFRAAREALQVLESPQRDVESL